MKHLSIVVPAFVFCVCLFFPMEYLPSEDLSDAPISKTDLTSSQDAESCSGIVFTDRECTGSQGGPVPCNCNNVLTGTDCCLFINQGKIRCSDSNGVAC